MLKVLQLLHYSRLLIECQVIEECYAILQEAFRLIPRENAKPTVRKNGARDNHTKKCVDGFALLLGIGTGPLTQEWRGIRSFQYIEQTACERDTGRFCSVVPVPHVIPQTLFSTKQKQYNTYCCE